jgi:hypothetical protein
MKTYTYLFLLLIAGCFFMACNSSSKPEDNGGYTTEIPPNGGYTPKSEDNDGYTPEILGELPIAPRVATQVEVVNNTGSTVTVLPKIQFRYDDKVGGSVYLVPSYHVAPILGRIEGNSTGSFVFVWEAKSYVLSTTDPAEVNNPFFEYSNLELASTVKKNFRPYVDSFLLPIRIDDVTYYLAGWPQSIGVPSGVDGSKIVKYGVGYADNKEIRLHEQYGYAYLPYIICYDEGGTTVTHDFGEGQNRFIMGKAVITIDAPDKIEYKTESLEAHTWRDYKWSWW